jgi:hemoglobin
MSKWELYKRAEELSGVSLAESNEAIALQPSIYDRIGEKGFRKLSERFYERVFADNDASWFLNIFSSSTKTEAVDNQYRFFVQTFGGPDLYRQKKGKYTRLVGRHASYNIGIKAADRWVYHMQMAIQSMEQDIDKETAVALENYFRFMAHYIVAASEYMRPDQVRKKLPKRNYSGTSIYSSHLPFSPICCCS